MQVKERTFSVSNLIFFYVQLQTVLWVLWFMKGDMIAAFWVCPEHCIYSLFVHAVQVTFLKCSSWQLPVNYSQTAEYDICNKPGTSWYFCAAPVCTSEEREICVHAECPVSGIYIKKKALSGEMKVVRAPLTW